MARRIEGAPPPARSTTTRRRSRSAAETRRLSGMTTEPVAVPRPREDTNATRSSHPIMHWVMITDDDGRTRPQARWL